METRVSDKSIYNSTLDKHWHLAECDQEINFTELEFAIIRIGAAFDRWQKDCLA